VKNFFIEYPVTKTLVGIFIAVFVLANFLVILTGGAISYGEMLYLFGAEVSALVVSGDIWRIVLPAFLHADIIHLAVNSFSLWYVGRYFENFYGGRNLWTVFILSSVLGSIVSVLSFVLSGQNVASVGASAGLFGILGLMLNSKLIKDSFSPDLPISTSYLVSMLLLNLFIGQAFANINNAAHIGGFIGGFILGFIIKPITPYKSNPLQDKIKIALFAFSIIIVVLSVAANIFSLFLG
jgi:rhomboid protease GluP